MFNTHTGQNQLVRNVKTSFRQTSMEHNVTYLRFWHRDDNANAYRIYITIRKRFHDLSYSKNESIFRERLTNVCL